CRIFHRPFVQWINDDRRLRASVVGRVVVHPTGFYHGGIRMSVPYGLPMSLPLVERALQQTLPEGGVPEVLAAATTLAQGLREALLGLTCEWIASARDN